MPTFSGKSVPAEFLLRHKSERTFSRKTRGQGKARGCGGWGTGTRRARDIWAIRLTVPRTVPGPSLLLLPPRVPQSRVTARSSSTETHGARSRKHPRATSSMTIVATWLGPNFLAVGTTENPAPPPPLPAGPFPLSRRSGAITVPVTANYGTAKNPVRRNSGRKWSAGTVAPSGRVFAGRGWSPEGGGGFGFFPGAKFGAVEGFLSGKDGGALLREFEFCGCLG